MIAGSVSAFTFIRMRASFPDRARVGDAAGLVDQTLAQVERRDEDLAKALRLAEARQVVEEVGDVGRDVRVGREEPEVLVEPAR